MTKHLQLPTSYGIIFDKYVDDLLAGILDLVNPVFSATPYIKRKRQTRKFKALNRLSEILSEKRKILFPKLINTLPSENRWDGYLRAKNGMIQILFEELGDVMDELDKLMNIINAHELDKSLKIDIKKQISVLNNIRDEIVEGIYLCNIENDEVIDACLTLDQAISLLIKLHEKNLKKEHDFNLTLSILILKLRIMAILDNGDVNQIKLLKGDIVEFTSLVDDPMNRETFESVVKLVG
jgi:hypothetical protein